MKYLLLVLLSLNLFSYEIGELVPVNCKFQSVKTIIPIADEVCQIDNTYLITKDKKIVSILNINEEIKPIGKFQKASFVFIKNRKIIEKREFTNEKNLKQTLKEYEEKYSSTNVKILISKFYENDKYRQIFVYKYYWLLSGKQCVKCEFLGEGAELIEKEDRNIFLLRR